MNKKTISFIILFAIIVFGLYFNIIYNLSTNWDDPGLINNPDNYSLTSANLKRIFTITASSTYQPVRDFSYILDYIVAPDNPVLAIHIHSIILYFFMILATWLFLSELFKTFSVEKNKAFLWTSFSILIFAVHPIHVESIAWLYARKEPLLGLFTMLSLWAFIKARVKNTDYYILCGIFLLLAILSKPTAFVVPAFMLVLDICLQIEHPQRKYWIKRGVFFLVAFVVVVPLSVWFVRMMMDVGGVKPWHGGTFWTNLLAVSQIFVEYISLYAATVYYSADYPIKLYSSLSDWQAWVYIILNLFLIGFAVYALFRRWYLITIFIALHYIFILPVSHIFPINNILQDRYALIPSLSWCVLLGWIITTLWYKRLSNSRFSENFPQLVAGALLLIVVISYSYMTFEQTNVWKNSFILWEHVLRKYPNSSSANVNMAAILIDAEQYEPAKQLCYMAIIEKPYDYLAISNMALAQMSLKEYKNAIHNYKIALDLKPDLINARIGLANCYLETGDIDKAYRLFQTITDNGDYSKASFGAFLYSRRALVAWKMGNKDEASYFLKKADISMVTNNKILQDITLAATSMGDMTLTMSSYYKLLQTLKDPKEIAVVKARIEDLKLKIPKE